jgi:hypothetical protein
MFNNIKEAIKLHFEEVYNSIKMVDVEEKFDLAFSRPFGLLLAKLGLRWKMTPNQVSVASLISGVWGGWLLYYQDDIVMTITGSLLVTFSGVLDSADGQLARLSKQSSPFGRVIDGFMDNWVFISCYVFATAYYVPIYGWWIFIFTILALLAHSDKSAIYEFYKTEYLFYGGGFKDSKIEYPDEIDKEIWNKSFVGKFLHLVLKTYTNKQLSISTRTRELRNNYESYGFNPKTQSRFQVLYKSTFKRSLTWWALICGSNFHRTLIMYFSIIGRFDIYLGINIVTYIPMYILNYIQKRKDNALIKQLNDEFGSI